MADGNPVTVPLAITAESSTDYPDTTTTAPPTDVSTTASTIATTDTTPATSTTAAETAPGTETTAETAATAGTETTPATATKAATAKTKVHKLVLKPEPGEEIENEEVDDLRKQKAAKDYSGEYGKRVYCKRHYLSMAPIKLIFMLGGRFPFTASIQHDGTYQYKFSFVYPLGIYFLFSTFTMFFTLICGVLNVAYIALDISSEDKTRNQRNYEDLLIKRYYIPLIFVYSSLIHGCIASLLIIAVYTMHMDVSKRARGFSVKVLVLFIAVVISLTLLAVFKIGPTAIGLPTVFGDLTFRMFISTKEWLLTESKIRRNVQIAGGFVLIFTFTASKSAILFFIYHCKTLQSAFAYWNGRVYAAVLRGGEFAQTEEGRTTYKLLFKDHCVLMDLMEGMDQVFAFTIESYFGCQVFSLFFELYFCIRTAKHGDNQLQAAYPEKNGEAFFVRPKDWAPGSIMLFVSLSLMLSAAKSAADVAEEAMSGLEVIRRKTMLGRKTDEELYFMLSMFSSYTAYKKMEINAGGYYYMNKDFIIGLISSVLSYFIILYQFQPVMDNSFPASDPNTYEQRKKFGEFLTDIEGLHYNHYETTTSKEDLWESFRN